LPSASFSVDWEGVEAEVVDLALVHRRIVGVIVGKVVALVVALGTVDGRHEYVQVAGRVGGDGVARQLVVAAHGKQTNQQPKYKTYIDMKSFHRLMHF